jgi:hypothetical protein
MAWGMHEPNGFGEFFPDAGYDDWKDALRLYYDTTMTVEQKSSMKMEKRILYSKFAEKFVRDHGPVNDIEAPRTLYLEKKIVKLGALIKTSNRILAVNEEFKSIIEELEPDVHQFFPIKIVMPRGNEFPDRYYVFRIGKFLDAFNPNYSDSSCYNVSGYENYRGVAPVKKTIVGLAVSKDVVDSAHIWREKKLSQPDIFLSDTLQARAVEAGLRLPKHFQMKEV